MCKVSGYMQIGGSHECCRRFVASCAQSSGVTGLGLLICIYRGIPTLRMKLRLVTLVLRLSTVASVYCIGGMAVLSWYTKKRLEV